MKNNGTTILPRILEGVAAGESFPAMAAKLGREPEALIQLVYRRRHREPEFASAYAKAKRTGAAKHAEDNAAAIAAVKAANRSPRQAELLTSIELGAQVVNAAAAAGIPVSTVHGWRQRYPDFARDYDEARRKGAALHSVGAEDDVVPTAEFCKRLGITESTFQHRRRRGQMQIRPKKVRGRTQFFSVAEGRKNLPPGLRLGEAPPTITRRDGVYRRVDLLTNDAERRGKWHRGPHNPAAGAGLPLLETVIDWIVTGCIHLRPKPDGEMRTARGFAIDAASPLKRRVGKYWYVHEKDFEAIMELRRCAFGREDRPGWITWPEAMTVIGVSTIARLKIALRRAKDWLGYEIKESWRGVTGSSIKREGLLNEQHVLALRKRIVELWDDASVRTEFVVRDELKLPKRAFITYRRRCRYLDKGRPLTPVDRRFIPDRKTGKLRYTWVYSLDDLKEIERRFLNHQSPADGGSDVTAATAFLRLEDIRARYPHLTKGQLEAVRKKLDRWKVQNEDQCDTYELGGKTRWRYPDSKVTQFVREVIADSRPNR